MVLCVCKIFGQIVNYIFFFYFYHVYGLLLFLTLSFIFVFFSLTLPQVSGFFWLLHIIKIRVKVWCRVLSLFIEMWKLKHLITEKTICTLYSSYKFVTFLPAVTWFLDCMN